VKQIHKIDSRSGATAYRGSVILFATPFVLIGTFFALSGFGYIPLPGKVNAPLWVIGFIGIAFAAAGLTLMFHGIRGVINQRRIANAERRHRGQPWAMDFAWNRRGIRDRAGSRLATSIFAPVFLACFLVPFNWWAFSSGDGRWMVRVIVGFFDLILVLVVLTAVYRLVQFLRFGHSRLAFRRFPFHPGESLDVAFSGTRLDDFTATLRFVEERFETRGSGKNRSTQLVTYEHFGEQRRFDGTTSAPEVEIRFEIPDNDEWVTSLSGQPVRYWELVIEGEQAGPDFRTTFPLPVYPRS